MSAGHDLLDLFRDASVLSAIDVHVAHTLGRLGRDARPEVLLGAAMACRAPRLGHVCADLRRGGADVRLEADDAARLSGLPWPDPATWLCVMRESPLVTHWGGPPGPTRPLVLDGERLYLQRYHRYECRLATSLALRALTDAAPVDDALLADGLARFFTVPPGSGDAFDLGRLGALLSVTGRLALLCGGPGTGKTTAVKRVLALLLEQAQALAPTGLVHFPPRILLLAPTGKAAARLREAIHEDLDALPVRDRALLAHLPSDASTIHRALGVRPDSATRFMHDAANPLPAEVVLVDEASMVDLALMAKLVDAVSPEARLILLGDRDQLASVEAGAVLGELARPPDGTTALSPALAARVERLLGAPVPASLSSGAATHVGGLADRVVHLHRSWRFGERSGIGALSRAINSGRPDDALAYLRGARTETDAPRYADLTLIEPPPREPLAGLEPRVLDGYAAYLEAALVGRDPRAALDALDAFRVLTPHRRGPTGVESLNRQIETWLSTRGTNALRPRETWYLGRPILVTHNDAQLRLFNGDVGVILADPADPTRRRAWFFGPSRDTVRDVQPAALPPHETVFAMTVHKSQGSQFGRVLLVLPDRPSPVLTRELLYTAVTRARTDVTIIGSEAVLRHAMAERVRRNSGLGARVWGSPRPAT